MSKRYGLRLTLGGAPDTAHHIPGLPGLYRTDPPTPVGEDGDVLTLEAAREYIDGRKKEIKDAEKAWDEFEAQQVAEGARPNGPIPFDKPAVELELVEISETKAAQAAKVNQTDIEQAKNGQREAVRAGALGAEAGQIADHNDAVKGA